MLKGRIKNAILKIITVTENNSIFSAIKQGMIMAIPLLIVSSMALMLMEIPIPAYQKFVNGLLNGKVVELLSFAHKGVMGFYAVILATSTSISYAMIIKQKKGYMNYSSVMILPIITLVNLAGYSGIQYDSFDLGKLGNLNTFTAIFVAIISGVLFFAVWEKINSGGWKRKFNNESMYMAAIEGIIPSIATILFFYLCRQTLQLCFHVDDIQDLMVLFTESCLKLINNNLGEGLLILFVIHILWFCGIHGSNVVESVMAQHYVDVEVGIYNKTFQDVFTIMGGCGATLCLVIAIILFAKKKNIRNITKLALPNVIFNISEIVVFGLPVILNPVFLIPFVLVPIVNYIISYFTIYIGLVPPVINEVKWTTPMLLSGYRATGSWAGTVLQAVCLVVGVGIYGPFVKLFELQSDKQLMESVKKLVDEFRKQEENAAITGLTQREDEIGNVARLLSIELEEAINKKELFLLYQPQINTKGECIGAEALIRWRHPVAGFIYPPLIIQLAKERGILYRLEEFIFDEATEALHKVQAYFSPQFAISVNITNKSLEWDGFETCLDACVKKHNVSADTLHLEITEQDALFSSNEVIEKVQKLKQKGYKLLIDDFGMGHTSLFYLQTNYFDVVKLDGSLIKGVMGNDRNSSIIDSIIRLGKTLNFITVAECVETQEQKEALEKLGCDVFQGYLYSKPISLSELFVWMEAFRF